MEIDKLYYVGHKTYPEHPKSLGGAVEAQSATPTMFDKLIGGAETAGQMALEIERRLEGVIARAVGPFPTASEGKAADSAVGGAFGTMDVRLSNTIETLRRVIGLLDQVEKAV